MNLFDIVREQRRINVYLNNHDILNLNKQLKFKQRATLLTEKHFIKVGTSTEWNYYNSLLNEMNICGTLNFSEVNTPKLLAYFNNEQFIILIYDKIEGQTLGTERNSFKTQLDIDRNQLFRVIKKIGVQKDYPEKIDVMNRDLKAEKYLEVIHKELDTKTKRNMECLIGNLHQNAKLVFSHGDLIPTNIIKTKNSFYIIDWEWASLRPHTYDAALFISFSNRPLSGIKTFENLDAYWDSVELYRDALVICAREIKNWLEVSDSPNQQKYLKLWVETLKVAEEWLMSH